MSKKFIVFDICGTLSDQSHRIDFAHVGDWDEFQKRAVDDPVIANVADIMCLLNRNFIILLTGRNEAYRYVTEKWLADSGLDGVYDELIMRPNGDFTPDDKLKIALLEERFGGKEGVLSSVLAVFEDRDIVVEALRNYGLTVFQPAPSGY